MEGVSRWRPVASEYIAACAFNAHHASAGVRRKERNRPSHGRLPDPTFAPEHQPAVGSGPQHIGIGRASGTGIGSRPAGSLIRGTDKDGTNPFKFIVSSDHGDGRYEALRVR